MVQETSSTLRDVQSQVIVLDLDSVWPLARTNSFRVMDKDAFAWSNNLVKLIVIVIKVKVAKVTDLSLFAEGLVFPAYNWNSNNAAPQMTCTSMFTCCRQGWMQQCRYIYLLGGRFKSTLDSDCHSDETCQQFGAHSVRAYKFFKPALAEEKQTLSMDQELDGKLNYESYTG